MFQIEGKLFFRSKKTLFAILVMLIAILASSFLAGYHNRQAKLGSSRTMNNTFKI